MIGPYSCPASFRLPSGWRIGFDPASASAPFVATLVDVTALSIYFYVALFFLKGTLL